MKSQTKSYKIALLTGLLGAVISMPVSVLAGPCSPCAPRSRQNPCNPCSPKNPCASKNPCAAGSGVDPKLVVRPKGTKPYRGASKTLVKDGEYLWNNPKLSSSGGISCASCHNGGALFQPSFAKPYPHQVKMAVDDAGLKSVTLEEMVQFCMVKPMQAKPFAWGSRELAELTAYTAEVQKNFKPGKATANPCAAGNPCSAKVKGCGACAPVANPCAGKNPCAVKNPCAAKSPCKAKNPCAAH